MRGALTQVDAGRAAAGERRAQGRHRDAARKGVHRSEVADEGGLGTVVDAAATLAVVAGRSWQRPRRSRRLDAGLLPDPGDDVRQRREVTQLEVLVAFDVEPLADGREHLRLLDRVDARSASRSRSRSSSSAG